MFSTNSIKQQTVSLDDNIPEGSCDTEDWSNDAENSALEIDYILEYIQMENSLNCKITYYFAEFFDQINSALVSIRDRLLPQ